MILILITYLKFLYLILFPFFRVFQYFYEKFSHILKPSLPALGKTGIIDNFVSLKIHLLDELV